MGLVGDRVGTTHVAPIGPDPYLAFACVHVKGVDWCHPGKKTPTQTPLPLKNPVAAFPLPELRELLIVEADGLLTRVPIPE